MTVLIPAATGQVAAGLARRLREAGVPIRALARDRARAERSLGGLAGIDLAVGELDDRALLAAAFEGVEAAFLSVGTDPRQTELEKAVIDAAARAGLGHLIKLSTVDTTPDSPNPVGRWHAEIEAHLANSGVPHTILRPAYFTTNLLRTAAPSVAATGRWAGTSPTGRIDAGAAAGHDRRPLRDPGDDGRLHPSPARCLRRFG
ncbi:NAD(P)H-binding protein [Nocardia takedensis]